MLKSLWKLILTLLILLSGVIYGAPAPGNAIIGTQATVTYTDTNAQEVAVQSNIVTVTINEVRGVRISPDVANYSARPGEYVSFPITVNNTGNIEDIYKIYTANDSNLPEISFTVDANGNGVIDGDENIVLQPYENLPPIGGGESLNVIVRGRISPNSLIGSTQTFIPHVRSINDNNIIDWNNNNFSIANVSDIKVVKKFGATGVADALLYVLEISNSTEIPGTNLVITDIIPSDLEFDTTYGVWTPINSTTSKNVTYADDGPEAISNDVELKVINGVMTFTVFSVPGNFPESASGGTLVFRMKPKGGTAPGTKIINVASYTYNNGSSITAPKNTNFLVYQIPSVQEGVEIINEESVDVASGDYITIPQTVINRGQVADAYNLSVEGSTYIENVAFYLDENGDGIKNSNETTPITVTPIINEGESINILMTGKVSSGTPLGSHIFKIYARSINFNQSDFSDITINVFQAGELVRVYPDKSLSGQPGNIVTIHQSIENLSGTGTSYYLYTDNPGKILDVKFFLDDNGDGTRQANENTQITTPLFLNGGETKEVFMVGQISPETPLNSTLDFRIYGRNIYNENILDWSDININISGANYSLLLESDLNLTIEQDNEITIPQKITNTGLLKDYYSLVLVNNNEISNYRIFVDENKDGIRQESEITEIYDMTPEVLPGETFRFFLVGDGTGPLGNQDFIIRGVSQGDQSVFDDSIINLNILENTAKVILKPNLILTGAKGEEVIIPQTLINRAPTNETYNLSILNTTDLENVKFYLDNNGDGVRQYFETTEIGVTPSVGGNGGELNFFAVGRIKTNAPTGIQLFKVDATGIGDSSAKDTSDITLNIIEAGVGVVLTPDVTISEVLVPSQQGIKVNQTLTNNSSVSRSFTLTLEENSSFVNPRFYQSTQSRSAGLETIVTNLGPGESFNFIFEGDIATNPTFGAQSARIYARATDNNTILDWSTIYFTVQDGANINIVKSIGETVVPGAFVYVFDFTNIGTIIGTDITLTDTLPNGVIPDIYSGVWFPTGGGSLAITTADDGAEVNASDIEFKVINGQLTFKLQGLIPGAKPRLALRVRTLSGVMPGSTLINMATYSYNDGHNIINKETNTISYNVPSQAIVGVKKSAVIDPNNSNQFLYKFKLSNTGDIPGTAVKIVDTLPTEINVIGTTAKWIPVNETTSKNITLIDDGQEAVSNEVNLKVVNGVMTFTINSIPGGFLESSNGGELILTVKPKGEIVPGTVIENTASFEYNNGYDGLATGRTTNVANYTVPVPTVANVEVIKKVGNTAVPGAFVYVFEIINTGALNGSNLVIMDTLPNEVELDDTVGVWKNFGSTTSNPITIGDDGEENNLPGITFKIIDGVMTGTVASVPAGVTLGNNGGEFQIRVRPKPGVTSGTVITNTGTYTYDNGDGANIEKTTVNADYTVPAQAIVGVEKKATIDPNNSGQFIYTFKITNTGSLSGTNFTLTDTLPSEIDVVSTDGRWRTFTSNTENILTLANDGGEGTNSNLDFSIVNGVLTLKINSIPSNITSSTPGGELSIIVKPKSGVLAGTVISNSGTYEYNNGEDGVVSGKETNRADYTVVTPSGPNLTIIKSIGETSVPGAFVYVFDFVNDGSENAHNIVLTDVLPEGVIPDVDFALWKPSANGTFVNITTGDDGTEANASWVTFKVVGRNLEFTRIQHDMGTTGTLTLRVRPIGGVAPGTVLTNIGNYSYTDINGSNPVNKTTNSATYTVPSQALVGIKKSAVVDPNNGAQFIYRFKVFNSGDINGTSVVLTDTLPNEVEVVGTTGKWQPVNQSTVKTITLADDGQEAVSNEVNLKVVNGVMTFTITSVSGNFLESGTGGILEIIVKPKSGVSGGTVVNNSGEFSYNNGFDGVVTGEKTNTATYTIPVGAPVLSLEKFQALDENSDNIIEGEYTKTALEVNPGTKIFYKLVITNSGTGGATNIAVADTIPEFTRMSYGDGSISEKGKPVWRIVGGPFTEISNKPVEGGTGTISVVIPRVNPGEIAEIYYNIKVDQ